MLDPLVRDLAAADAPVRVPVAVTCRVLGYSRQAYYARLRRPIGQRDRDDAVLTNAAVDAHADDPEFGHRLLADELRAAGHAASDNQVWRLRRQQRIFSAHSRKRGLNRRPGPPVHDDLLSRPGGRRDFTPPAANMVWLTDITEHPTAKGKLYPRAIKNLWSCGDNAATESFRPAAEERVEPPPLDHPSPAEAGDRRLDREDLPPTSPSNPPRTTHPIEFETIYTTAHAA